MLESRAAEASGWPSGLVETARPVHLHERCARKELSRDAIEDIEVAVPVRPQHQFGRLAVPVHIDQHGNLNRVVVVGVVRGELEVPLQLAGVRVESNDRIRVEIVARTLVGIPVRSRVPHAPVHQIELGVV